MNADQAALIAARDRHRDVGSARHANLPRQILVVGARRNQDGVTRLRNLEDMRRVLKAAPLLRPSLASLPVLELTYQVIAQRRGRRGRGKLSARGQQAVEAKHDRVSRAPALLEFAWDFPHIRDEFKGSVPAAGRAEA